MVVVMTVKTPRVVELKARELFLRPLPAIDWTTSLVMMMSRLLVSSPVTKGIGLGFEIRHWGFEAGGQ